MKRILLDSGLDPYALFAASRADHPHAFILESLTGPARLAEHTFVGFDPEIIISYRSGGLVGYVSYEFVRNLDSVPAHADSPFPEFEFGLYLDGVIVDHVRKRAEYFAHGRSRVEDLPKANEASPKLSADSPKRQINQERFVEAVAKARAAIHEGEAFQVVLSRREYGRMAGDPLAFYESLRRLNPSPYMYYLDFGMRRVIGASPEMLLRVEDRTATTFPIAGTRPLGTTLPEMERFRAELLADEKERAEHNMLLDLARNDLGKVCRFGTVKVPQCMTVERYSHVQHLVSRVEGELAPGTDALDALAAVFPSGTVSGAPKPRAMEILHDLEGTARRPYAGVVGYLSLNGNVDTAIAIRTLFADGPTYYLQAGAGIVADSDPTREWLETEHKLEGLRAALREAAA